MRTHVDPDSFPTHPVTAIGFLKWLRLGFSIPASREGKRLGPPSNGELRRWLTAGSVRINGERPKPGDIVNFPISQLIYFAGNSMVTVIDDGQEHSDGH